MSDTTRRDALVRSFAWRVEMCSAAEIERIDEVLSKLEAQRDRVQPAHPGAALTAKVEHEYRRMKSITIPPIVGDPRDVVGDGPTHAPDELGGES